MQENATQSLKDAGAAQLQKNVVSEKMQKGAVSEQAMNEKRKVNEFLLA